MEVKQFLPEGSSDLKMNKWDTKDSAGCFDCNICLDSTREPVVTLCGHLYCWPCIYKWLTHDPNLSTSTKPCPVCKAPITPTALIPLYGRGGFEGKAPLADLGIPKRPAAAALAEAPAATPADAATNDDMLGYDSLHHSQQQYYQYHQYYHHPRYNQYLYSADGAPAAAASSQMNFRDVGRLINPTSAAVSGGIVYALLPWVFGLVFGCPQSQVNYADLYDTRRSYHERSAAHRWLWRERQAEISLNRVSVFLLCCLVLCLLLF